MAIYRLIANGSFGPPEINAMTAAYEAALLDLALVDRDDPITEIVATAIVSVTEPFILGSLLSCYAPIFARYSLREGFGMHKGAIILVALLLVGCATITKGTTQTVAIDTPGVAGASCTITTQEGPQLVQTPGTVTLKKGSEPLPILCTKACYVNGQSIIPSNAEAMAAGNVIFGGVIGLGVDAVSGALNKYPDLVSVSMSPDYSSSNPACRPPRPAPSASKRTSARGGNAGDDQ